MLPYGLFSWVDLSAPDPKGAKEFYSQLFGWEIADQIDGEGNYIYTLFRIDGRAVAGLGGQSEELRKRGLPACWTSYINVESVDDSLALIKTFGGTVLVPGMDIMTAGRMGLASDRRDLRTLASRHAPGRRALQRAGSTHLERTRHQRPPGGEALLRTDAGLDVRAG